MPLVGWLVGWLVFVVRCVISIGVVLCVISVADCRYAQRVWTGAVQAKGIFTVGSSRLRFWCNVCVPLVGWVGGWLAGWVGGWRGVVLCAVVSIVGCGYAQRVWIGVVQVGLTHSGSWYMVWLMIRVTVLAHLSLSLSLFDLHTHILTF